MSTARKPRVVRASEFDRIMDRLAARGITPAAYDLLPGGAVRLHAVDPSDAAVNDDDGAAGWDEALAG